MNPNIRTLGNVRRPRPLAAAWCAAAAAVAMAGFGGAAVAQNGDTEELQGELEKQLTQKIREQVSISKLPPPGPRRVYVMDSRAFEVFTQVMVINGKTGSYAGTINTGLLPVPAVPPDGSPLYIADSVFTDYSEDERDAKIRVYDPQTLTEIKEIDIPEERFLAMSQESYTRITPNGRYLLFTQFAPVNGVGIVDLKAGEYLNTINTPQCFYVFPSTDRSVVLHCRDGSLLKVTFDENGELVDQFKTEPFHDPVKEPTYNDPAYARLAGKIFFISFWGDVFPVDISGEKPQFGEPWSLVTDEERKAGWKPGGWQVATYHPDSQRLYVLMDQRGKWTQNTESRYVWVYDTTTGEKVREMHLAHPARSLFVDQGEPPYLYALSAHHQNLTIYNAKTGAITGFIDGLGVEPVLVVGAAATASGK